MSEHRNSWEKSDYVMAMVVMSLMGGFYWAIRGTTGYGGETGGMLAGFGWALLWYGLSRLGAGAEHRPYGGPWILVAITLGTALGGLTGYGVYVGWLNGTYCLNHPDLCRPVSAWTGYGMLFLCGLHWGGNTGCFMAWCAPRRPLRPVDWAARIGCGITGALAAALFVRVFPQVFLPFYSEGVYGVAEYKTCARALDSIRTIAPHVGLFLGFLAYEIIRWDKRAVAIILTMALGFAIPFSVGGYWHTFNGSVLNISWWKNWEMSIGLGGGLAFGFAFWHFNRPGPVVRQALAPWSAVFFRSGLPLWLPSVMVLKGLYEGRCEMATMEPSNIGYAVTLALPLIPMLAVWIWHRRTGTVQEAEGYVLSYTSILAFQFLILASGWAVTIPAKWRLASAVLAVLYACYLGGSAVLLFQLRHRLTAHVYGLHGLCHRAED